APWTDAGEWDLREIGIESKSPIAALSLVELPPIRNGRRPRLNVQKRLYTEKFRHVTGRHERSDENVLSGIGVAGEILRLSTQDGAVVPGQIDGPLCTGFDGHEPDQEWDQQRAE